MTLQKKTVNLQFLGNGTRHVKVGYVVERPIWKTSYRLLLKDKGKLFMQGWALVENTSDDDWNGVRVVLVSGRPISYQMNLYEPLYLPRPWVEPELFASLRPPVYSGTMNATENEKKGLVEANRKDNAIADIMKQYNKFYQEGKFREAWLLAMRGKDIDPNNLAIQAAIMQADLAVGRDRSKRIEDDWENFYNEANDNSPGSVLSTRNPMTVDGDFLKRARAKRLGAALTGMNFKEGITSVATAEELGDYYQYVIDQKVTLPRQKSAMLPILNQHLDGSKISIFNEDVHAKYPLLGLRLKNTSGQPLTQGPITVFEDGAYAGDTRILDLQPGEERLLSYALDQATEVKVTSTTSPSPDMTFKIGGDNLTADYKLRQTRTYTLKNRGTHEPLGDSRTPDPQRLEVSLPDEGPGAKPRRVPLPGAGAGWPDEYLRRDRGTIAAGPAGPDQHSGHTAILRHRRRRRGQTVDQSKP